MGRAFSATILEVYDADTFKVDIDLGFYTHVQQWLRLKGIDATELEEPLGKDARDFVSHLMPIDTRVKIDVELIKTRKGEEDIKWTFRRFVASVTLPDGKDLATAIRQAGYVREHERLG